jgi:thiosulfate/3-mercaptopyruvate sulfurtransferase
VVTYKTIISCDALAELIKEKNTVSVIDCRFSLDDTNYGRNAFHKAHIPGAAYAHLDRDLSSKIIPGITGRHPLPAIDSFILLISNWGLENNKQVVAYDDSNGAFAARLWWLLRWLGHDKVALLDGGWQAWIDGGFPTESETPTLRARTFTPNLQPNIGIDSKSIEKIISQSDYLLIDSRSPERYSGKEEPIDPIAGHIPGAINAFHGDNIDENGFFLCKDILRARFQSILGDTPANKTVFYCGSGVTAALNLVALKHAGLGDGILYTGSWSEWITEPDRPIERSPYTA